MKNELKILIAIIGFLGGVSFVPREALGACGMGNQCPVVNSLLPSSDPAPAGLAIELTCGATDPNGVITKFTFQADGGAFENGLLTIDVVPPVQQQTSSATVVWNVPETPDVTYTLTCIAWDNGGFMGVPAQSAPFNINILAIAFGPPPEINSIIAEPNEVYPGETTMITAVAFDPEGGELTYQWSATEGVIYGDNDEDPNIIYWQSPEKTGGFAVQLIVTNPQGQKALSSVLVTVVWAKVHLEGFSVSQSFYPERLATDKEGNIYVSDSRSRSIIAFTPPGGLLRVLQLQWRPGGIAVGNEGNLYVGDLDYGGVKILDVFGRERAIGGEGGMPATPIDIALDNTSKRIYVADGKHRVIWVFNFSGAFVAQFSVDTAYPVSVTVNEASGEIYVSDSSKGEILVFNNAYELVRKIGGFGNKSGKFTRVGGVALDDDGVLYGADIFQSRVGVFREDGNFITFIGDFGVEIGKLNIPIDVLIDKYQRLLVSNSNNGRVEIYELMSSIAISCNEDSDCDGMPDWWEEKYGLNPLFPYDAFLDLDGDGLANVIEYKYKTNPSKPDTDFDGMSDREEILAESDPLKRNNGYTSPCPGDNDCDGILDEWELRYGLNPNFSGDASSDFDGDGVANIDEYRNNSHPYLSDTDGDGVSDGEEIRRGMNPTNDIDNRPQAVVAAIPIITEPTLIALDGGRSTDPNGDALTYRWEQISGPESVVLNNPKSETPFFVARKSGDYRFRLVVSDGKVESKAEEAVVTILNVPPVADAGMNVGGILGETITLDGRFSSDANGDSLIYRWKPPLESSGLVKGIETSRPIFSPQSTGVYLFELTVSDGINESVSDKVYVIVETQDDHIPYAKSADVIRGAIGDRIVLDGSQSVDSDGDELTFSWRQMEGAPVTIEGEDTAIASFTSKTPGKFRFELTVNDGKHVSIPSETVVEIGYFANAPPIADGGGDHRVETLEKVALNCDETVRRNTNPVECRWRQIEGDYVRLIRSEKGLEFIPIESGVYLFELEVTDYRGFSGKDKVTVVVDDLSFNYVPIAKGVSLLSAKVGENVILDGEESFDNDVGDALNFQWTQISGPRAILDDTYAPKTSFIPLVEGEYIFELRVDDNKDRSPSSLVSIIIGRADNAPPIARAGDDKLGITYEPIVLNGCDSSDPEGEALSFYWYVEEAQSEMAIDNLNICAPKVTASISGCTHTLGLKVNDGEFESQPDTANVNIVDIPLKMERMDVGGGEIIVQKATSVFNGLIINIPYGALSEERWIALGEITRNWLDEAGREAFGNSLFFGPAGKKFQKEVELLFPINSELQGAGLSEDEIGIVFYDNESEEWLKLENALVDLKEGMIKVETTKQGVFQITVPEGWDRGKGEEGKDDENDGGMSDEDSTVEDRDIDNGDKDATDSHKDTGMNSDDRKFEDGLDMTNGNNTGCSCKVGGGEYKESWNWLVATVIAILSFIIFARRRRATAAFKGNGKFFLVLFLTFVVLPTSLSAFAADAPHDATNLPNICQDCHQGHNAPGMYLMKAAGNSNLCFSCHASYPSVAGWAVGDQAVPGESGTSHRWDAQAVNPAYGASTPTNEALSDRVSSDGKIMCSTCHDQHSQAKGNPFMRISNTGDAMCKDCHSGRATANGGSHPVGVVIPGAGYYQNPSNLRLYSGKVECSTCHTLHYSYSNTSYNGAATSGDTTTLADTGASWPNLAGWMIVVQDVSDSRVIRRGITSGSGTSLTVGIPFDFDVDAGDAYYIYNPSGSGNGYLLDVPFSSMCAQCHTLTPGPAVSQIHLNTTNGALWPGGQYGSSYARIDGSNRLLPPEDTTRGTPSQPLPASYRGLCLNCHWPHKGDDNPTTAYYPRMLVEQGWSDYDTPAANSDEEDICFTCHDGSPVAKNIRSIYVPTPVAVTAFYLRNVSEVSPSEPMPNDHQSGDTFQGGTWIGRAMNASLGGSAESKSQTVSSSGSPVYWRMATFTSPSLAAGNVSAGMTWTIRLWAQVASTSANAYLRATIYKWNSDDTKGTVIFPITTCPTPISTTMSEIVWNVVGNAVAFNDGDKLVLEVEIQSQSDRNRSVTYRWGDATNNSRLVVPTGIYVPGATAKTYRHAVTMSGKHKLNEGAAQGWNPASNRHGECVDCHSPHFAEQGTHAVGSDAISGPIKGVWGVSINSGNTVTGTASFTQNSTSVTGSGFSAMQAGWNIRNNTHGIWYKIASITNDTNLTLDSSYREATQAGAAYTGAPPYSASYTRVEQAPSQSGLCLKCHSTYAWTSSPPNAPTGGPNGQAWVETDVGKDFSPYNFAYHPLFTPGLNQPLKEGRANTCNPNWPFYETGTVTTNPALKRVTLSGGTFPAGIGNGWWIAIGANGTTNACNSTTPKGPSSAPAVNWYKIASRDSGTQLTLYSTPVSVSGVNYRVVEGLKSTFVDGWSPDSLTTCDDCHGDSTPDVKGAHGSDQPYILKPINTTVTKTDINGNVVSLNAGADAYNFCLNCHSSNVYGEKTAKESPPNANYSRFSHPANGRHFNINGSNGTRFSIWCMNCHGGSSPGAVHGSNLGKQSGTSPSGFRFMNGSSLNGRTNALDGGACWCISSANDVSTCTQHSNKSITVNYYY